MNHFHRALQGMSLGKSKPYFSKGYVGICFEIYFDYIVGKEHNWMKEESLVGIPIIN